MGRRSGTCSRGSKKSVLFYTTDCGGDDKEDIGLGVQQRSISLTALHTGSPQQQQQLLEPRMAQLETLEAKMASIEVSLSTTPRRKKGGSISGGITSVSSSGHRNKDCYKEVDALRVALRDKENIIQTLKGQLCNSLSNRLALRNGAPPLTEADKKSTEERLQRLRRDIDNKRLAIKNLKLALERLDISDNIDVRIQQAELEYRLGREELELLTLREESRSLQAALELAETQEKQKNDTIFSCITGGAQMTLHAVEVSADPKSPRFGAGPRDDAAGLYVDWAIEDSGLCKGDRILEVNGKLVVGAGKNDLARLLAVAPDAAQIVVLRKSTSLAALRSLRSENLRLTHRISYLEEQVRDLLTPARTEVAVDPPAIKKDTSLQVFQKGPQVTALVAGLPGLLNVRTPNSASKNREHLRRFNATKSSKELDALMEGFAHLQQKSRHRVKIVDVTRSTASLDCKSQGQGQNKRSPKYESSGESRSRKSLHGALSSLEFDSEPTYYRMQDTQSRASEHSTIANSQEIRVRPTPPKKPLRLSLHRAASLQSVGSATPAPAETPKKPTKRNYRGDPPTSNRSESGSETTNGHQSDHQAPQPPPRTPSRAESCQSALRWPSPKPRAQLTSVSIDKWC